MSINYEVPDWTKNHYQDKGSVRKCARPWKMVHKTKAAKAVLCCHGYTGYPGELVRPGRDLYEVGFDVYAVRYPGHGTTGEDFLKSKAEDWIGTAYDAYSQLKDMYGQVYLVGHSMGGAIATILADAFDAKRLALLAPALVIPSLPVLQVRFLRHFVKRMKKEWKRDPLYSFYYEGDEDDDAFLGSEYWSFTFPSGVWELERVRRQAVACIEHLKADTLSVSGGLDNAIPQEASLLVVQKPLGKNKHLHIPTATHLLPYDKDKAAQDEAMKAVVDWLVGE
ncbi:alpha/beta fold hydrolase [uncultured Sphaerochaeta sp.]|uniref:alpha/beta hydrolase n=1 Tax=uncultured Sphaerochaeta sp. TaxID=886478 RepID=UPI002A0A126B|nr:alpha/beta fold hydrolase [uncultured Sphaerochaeta sp.]